jgi:hydroxymethylpyrimidine pyrophosphatase-like HAD family hydrolase
MVIAVDVDGTLFDGVDVAEEAVVALRSAHVAGHAIIIVTGRRWEELGHVVPDVLELTDRVVCEEGGVLVNVRNGQVTLLAEPVEPALIAGLRAAGVPSLDIGHVVVGAPTASLAVVTGVRDRVGSRRAIITNKGSIALTPTGCDKGTGLRSAIADLQLQHLPILAIGDASNDLAMFEIATIAIGVANADDAVRASGVQLTTASAGRGVAEALLRFLPRPSQG